MVKSHRDLIVWQKAMDLVADVYRLTDAFPERERFGLTSQIRRAAVSVPSNIAEGQGRMSTGEFKHFLGNARGSLCELDTQMLIAKTLGFAVAEDVSRIELQMEEVGRLLNGLIRSLPATH